MATRGRPRSTEAQATAMVVRIIDAALALHNRQGAKLRAMGLTVQQAARLVSKRHRGRVSELLGDSLTALAPGIDKTAGAVRLVLDHKVSISTAAERCDIDRSNLAKAIKATAKARQAAEFRAIKHHGVIGY